MVTSYMNGNVNPTVLLLISPWCVCSCVVLNLPKMFIVKVGGRKKKLWQKLFKIKYSIRKSWSSVPVCAMLSMTMNWAICWDQYLFFLQLLIKLFLKKVWMMSHGTIELNLSWVKVVSSSVCIFHYRIKFCHYNTLLQA